MKTLNFLTTGAAAAMLLLGSCTKDVDNPQGNGDGGVVEGIPTYATVSLSQRSTAGTYAGEDVDNPDQLPGNDYTKPEDGATTDEKKVNSAVVLVFNENDVLENLVEFGADELSKSFPTTTGKKRLYALANIPDNAVTELKNIFAGGPKADGTGNYGAADKQLSKVCEVIQQIENIDGATKKKNADGADEANFWMSNVYKLNATSEEQKTVYAKTQQEVDNGQGKEEENNFTIYIGRMVAKVTPTFAENLEPLSGDGKIDTKGAEYRVRNNPKQFYTFPVYKDVKDDKGQVVLTDVLQSPYFEKTYNADKDKADKTKEITEDDFFSNGPDKDKQFGTAMGTASYLTENSPKEAKRHKVTFLSIKATWTPTADALLLDADGSTADNAAATLEKITNANGGTFYRVQKWDGGKIVGYCPGIYAETPTAWTDVDGTPGDTAGNLADKVNSREEAKASKTPCYLIVTYQDGEAYWAYWMRSRLDGAIAEKYALKRNNHFKVNIISVDGLGEPNEDDNLDKDEDIEADSYMKATIEVLNWNEVNIEGGI